VGSVVTGRNSIGRRIERLEAIANVLSTADKWALIERGALRLMSDRNTVVSFDDAFWMAMGANTVRFTIPEMDELLAADQS
jgi:hypothetical protein